MIEGKHNARERKVRVEEILVEVGLKDYLHKRPDYMSGGQQQRVAVARALVKKPKLVLAEKPTANLDSETGDMIIHLMLALNQKFKTTFVFSTHDPMVMEHAKRLLRLKDGKLVDS